MKPKQIVTLVLLLVGLAVVYSAFRRSGLDRTLTGLLSPAPTHPSRSPSGVVADVMTGPLTGASQIGGGVFGPTSSPIANQIGVTTAPPTAAPSAPLSGATPVPAASGTIGPSAGRIIDANDVNIGGVNIGIGGGPFAGRPADFLKAIAPAGPAISPAAAAPPIVSSPAPVGPVTAPQPDRSREPIGQAVGGVTTPFWSPAQVSAAIASAPAGYNAFDERLGKYVPISKADFDRLFG